MSGVDVPEPPARTWLSLAAAIGFNLIPIIGVLFWGWSAFALVFLYWLENVVIGVRTLLSMMASAAMKGAVGLLGGLFLSAFFTVHYGMFCLVHGLFVVTLFGRDMNEEGHFTELPGAILAQAPNLAWGFLSIALWQFAQLAGFLVSGEAHRADPSTLMAAPYPRIMVLHFTILGGAFVLLALGQPLAGVLALALWKTAFDVADVIGKTPRIARAPASARA